MDRSPPVFDVPFDARPSDHPSWCTSAWEAMEDRCRRERVQLPEAEVQARFDAECAEFDDVEIRTEFRFMATAVASPTLDIQGLFRAQGGGEELCRSSQEMLLSVVQPTFGLLLFRDQFADLVGRWVGWPPVEAESLLRAFGRKNHQDLRAWKARYLEAGLAGTSRREALRRFRYLHDRAGYISSKDYWLAEAFLAAGLVPPQR